MNPTATPPTTVPTRNSHRALVNSADSSAARQTSSSGSPAPTLRRLDSRADTAWLTAAMTKIRNDAPPISARLCTPSIPCRNVGTRLLNCPSTLNAAKTPRHAPSMTAPIPGGMPSRGRTLTAPSGLRTVSGMTERAAAASTQRPR